MHLKVVWSWNTFNMPAITKGGKWGNKTWDEWYPGDDAVSWVGINAFTGNGPDGIQGYSSVQDIYKVFYLWVEKKQVPTAPFHRF